MESLHNIQADSDGSGDIVVGGELYGYGHVGRDAGPGDSDCWGCHGYSMSSDPAPGSGPMTPFISSSDNTVITAGTDMPVTLSGSAFTNIFNTTNYISSIVLTAADGSTIDLAPSAISESTLTVTIPGTISAGIYAIRAVKDDVLSNPMAITIKPAIEIGNTACGGCTGITTITGTGFGDAPPEGAEEFLNVMANGVALEVISWTDTEIKVSGGCSDDSLTVNALMGSATQ
jgi:hypothetical protein